MTPNEPAQRPAPDAERGEQNQWSNYPGAPPKPRAGVGSLKHPGSVTTAYGAPNQDALVATLYSVFRSSSAPWNNSTALFAAANSSLVPYRLPPKVMRFPSIIRVNKTPLTGSCPGACAAYPTSIGVRGSTWGPSTANPRRFATSRNKSTANFAGSPSELADSA